MAESVDWCASFREASTKARKMAVERGISVALVRQGERWGVERPPMVGEQQQNTERQQRLAEAREVRALDMEEAAYRRRREALPYRASPVGPNMVTYGD